MIRRLSFDERSMSNSFENFNSAAHKPTYKFRKTLLINSTQEFEYIQDFIRHKNTSKKYDSNQNIESMSEIGLH